MRDASLLREQVFDTANLAPPIAVPASDAPDNRSSAPGPKPGRPSGVGAVAGAGKPGPERLTVADA